MINLQLSDGEVKVLYTLLEKEYRRLETSIAPPNQTQGTREKKIVLQNDVWGIMDALTPFI